jgi:phosphoglycerate dehydrogenase-like enzyme
MRRAVLNMRDERPIWAPPASLAHQLRDALPPEWELVDVAGPVSGRGDGGGLTDEALAAVRGAEIYFGLGLPRELLRAALQAPARLRWVHTGAAGVASLLHPELTEHHITLTNSAGIHGPAMAETALAMMLHFFRGLDFAVRAQPRRVWDAATFENSNGAVRELDGATLGILGYGGVGRELARRAAALGMRVLALRRLPTADDVALVLTGDDALERILAESDVVVITMPSTTNTRGMIGARELAFMRPGAVLVNLARGDIVDHDALLEALRSRRLRAAALDVFPVEPLPADSPFWSLDNVLITPHVSATTTRFWERETVLILDNLHRYLTGQPLRNVVDPRAGY